jgi:hypothetical protein
LTAFGNSELRNIFVPKKLKIREERRRLHDKELCDAL